MKKILAILLSVMLLLSLSACGKSGSEGGSEPTIIGTWKGNVDVGALLSSVMEGMAEEEILCQMIFTFRDDGTYTTSVDPESAEEALDEMVDAMVETLEQMYAAGGSSLEEMLAEEGMTLEDMKEEYKEEMSVESFLGGMVNEGYYKLIENKIHITESEVDLKNGEFVGSYHVTLSGNTLTITDMESEGELASEMIPALFPIVLKK